MIRGWLASHPWVRSDEITETAALSLLADGFDWRYEGPVLVLTTSDAEVLLEDGRVRRWYLKAE